MGFDLTGPGDGDGNVPANEVLGEDRAGTANADLQRRAVAVNGDVAGAVDGEAHRAVLHVGNLRLGGTEDGEPGEDRHSDGQPDIGSDGPLPDGLDQQDPRRDTGLDAGQIVGVRLQMDRLGRTGLDTQREGAVGDDLGELR